ncbi:type I 3-dehydroquinate dehydratase [Clostridium novyi]|uniref:type I 3-dehydroquinate dehydratase n=1 Tax=Clostridium novyi TaxID=1542 RepID=UPI0004D91322|nr:type I 3-dehydroquinate dehydratase [Clostridium novyi]KEH90966.1 3-dehydroquinate dehydratase [Clostridium novyi A str. BKT29909]KEH95880.1 3-dehydroquinate dehydratase [Clostridium novyi A str. GD211209]
MKTVNIRGVILGEGIPKVCTPLVGRSLKELREEINLLKDIDCDLVEFRADFFEHVENIQKVKEVLLEIREALKEKPILFTFRSAKEGGEREVESEFYCKLNKEIIKTKLIDAIDIELFNEEESILELIKIAHDEDVKVVMSNHDFHKTPPKEEMISRLVKMQELGADVTKIAVMPKGSSDVLTLLEATNDMKIKYAKTPFITMSMKGVGMISRISGEVFGSAVTFGASKKASAPGQLQVKELKEILNVVHNAL